MRPKWMRAARISLTLICCGSSVRAAQLIVQTPPKEPQDELKAFHVPPGFEVQLVASEPDIHKPINMAFDDRGRLWVSDTEEYPFPAPQTRKARDTVKILADFDANGKARKITTFADNLNIPIGVLPMGDHDALAFSIPYIWKLTDTHGAGHADQRRIFLGTYGHDDTHGLTGSFTEGFDGWIYAVHGFRNTSTVKASDGSQITMNSGNTYRFRRDGSRIEYFTHGQVNPFGLCFDPLGNLYSSDCETKPLALLLREAYYPSFGKPDDGLGFAPEICDHMYGSTAIAGLCDYVADQLPPEYRNRLFVGNVVTNKINDAELTPRGSGVHADDAPDFLTSDDNWFRPVNIKLGPDGALYVADFYNRIIGHYEVDLHNPGRDRQRGRIWRIVYKGKGATPAPAEPFDLTKASVPEIIDDLANPNLTIRMLAMNRLADVVGRPAVAPLKAALARTEQPLQWAHGLWVLYRLGALDDQTLQHAALMSDQRVKVHVTRILAEMPVWDAQQRQTALALAHCPDPVVRRVAAEALGRHPEFDNIRTLLDLRREPGIDPYLLYTVRMALRDQLLQPGIFQRLESEKLSDRDRDDLADAAAGAGTPQAATFLLHYVEKGAGDRDAMARYLRTIARYVQQDRVDELARFVVERFPDDLDLRLALFKSVQDGLSQRGMLPGEAVRAWGEDLASKLLAEGSEQAKAWSYHPLPGSADTRSPWGVQTRSSADGNSAAPFLSSNVRGETLTGVVRSAEFTIPPKLSFFLAGHNGPPAQEWPIRNVVRLRDADTNAVLIKAIPPRSEVAQKVNWDLSKYAGRRGYFEATDGDAAQAYAWLAFGRFDPPVVLMPAPGPRLHGAVQIVASLHLTSLADEVEKVLTNDTADDETRAAAAYALRDLGASPHVKVLAAVVRDPSAPDWARRAAADALGSVPTINASTALVDALRIAPQRLQLAFAKSLAATRTGAQVLLDSIRQGKASARLLQDPNIREQLNVAKPADLDEQIAQLTRGLPSADEEIQKLIDQRAAAFDPAQASVDRGRLVFQKNCMVCHMIGGQGAHVGPQLDGIGARGIPRLCEDILDPSRNVDVAFRYSTFVLSDGNVLAGIPRREEGQTLTVADSTGKEVVIQKSTITRRVESTLSLMPSNFGDAIPPQDFNDLLSYLLSTKQ